MSLIRLIQESDVIKNGGIFSLKPYTCELEVLKQIIKEKDVLIDNHIEKIKELEDRVADLEITLEAKSSHQLTLKQQQLEEKTHEEKNIEMTDQEVQTDLEEETKQEEESNHENQMVALQDYSEMTELINKYEKFISEITVGYEVMKEKRNVANVHLACLECSFADLVEKYERLKNIVTGYQVNQDVLLEHLDTYKNAMNLMQKRYEDFKNYANTKLNEANVQIEQQDKKHISNMAKVKSQLLQTKVKISELEKTLSTKSAVACMGDITQDITSKKSLFQPLYNNF